MRITVDTHGKIGISSAKMLYNFGKMVPGISDALAVRRMLSAMRSADGFKGSRQDAIGNLIKNAMEEKRLGKKNKEDTLWQDCC